MPEQTTDLGERCRNIKLLILDVDGVLTDGRIYFDAEGREMKVFHARDGHGIKLLQRSGVDIAVISGRETPLVVQRLNSLGVTRIYQKIDDKIIKFRELLTELGLQAEEVAYVGDDTIDLDVMRAVKLAVAVADAHPEVLAAADWITERPGGLGAVREVCDRIMAEQA